MRSDAEAFLFHRHPAERRQRRRSLSLCTGSCCCCCLHSVGALAGALTATLRSKKGGRGILLVYWFGLIVGVGQLALFVETNTWIVTVVFGLPVIQLIACLWACLALPLPLFKPRWPHAVTLFWIAVGTLAGTAAGIAILGLVVSLANL